jgi:hypothetical protein
MCVYKYIVSIYVCMYVYSMYVHKHEFIHTYIHTYIQGTAFIMGCCWSLTRPYAALVLFLIATSGALICPTGTWPLVALWMGMSVGVFLFYFVFLPDADEVPYTKNIDEQRIQINEQKNAIP